MSITVIVSFKAKPDQVKALLDFLSAIQEQVISGGCESISLLQDQNDPTRIFEIEKWPSAEHHQKFMAQAGASGTFDSFGDFLAEELQMNYLNMVRHSQ